MAKQYFLKREVYFAVKQEEDPSILDGLPFSSVGELVGENCFHVVLTNDSNEPASIGDTNHGISLSDFRVGPAIVTGFREV